MIDIHSHILPNIDDGAQNLNHSLEMLKIAKDSGTNYIVATPHYFEGMYEESYKSVCKIVNKLNESCKDTNIDIKILTGQEVLITKNTLENYKKGVVGTINNTSYMLVEFDMHKWKDWYLDVLYELKVRGVNPIIAHPERYRYILEDETNINKILKEGYAFQINSGSIIGIFGKQVQKTSKKFIEHGICNFVASDAHTINRRKPGIKDALHIVKDINNSVYEKVIYNSKNMIENKDLRLGYETIKKRKTFFSFFRK